MNHNDNAYASMVQDTVYGLIAAGIEGFHRDMTDPFGFTVRITNRHEKGFILLPPELLVVFDDLDAESRQYKIEVKVTEL